MGPLNSLFDTNDSAIIYVEDINDNVKKIRIDDADPSMTIKHH